MDLGNMFFVCGIPDLQNPAGNRLTQIFIFSRGFKGVDDFTILCIEDVPNMKKYHN